MHGKPLLLLFALLGAGSAMPSMSAPDDVLPGGRAEDARRAQQEPDRYAWDLFLALNRQAKAGVRGIPDPQRSIREYEADKPTVWETWALASGGRGGSTRSVPNVSEVFLDRGAKPLAWDDLPKEDRKTRLEGFPSKRLAGDLEGHGQDAEPTRIVPIGSKPGVGRTSVDPSFFGKNEGQETRMNRATFEFVRNNGLYSIEGLEKNARDTAANGVPMKLPATSQEIKAHWIHITDAVRAAGGEAYYKKSYHWRTLRNAKGEDELWVATGFHIITKDLANWFWCDFQHKDFLGGDAFLNEAEFENRDAAYPDGAPPETKGTKWENYRLRGTQIDYVDATGNPVILANTRIEKGFQQSSSCMTCHSRATVGQRSQWPGLPSDRTVTLPIFLTTLPQFPAKDPILVGAVGTPDNRWFRDSMGKAWFQPTDFLWSIPFRALSVKETPPTGK